jgi:hypothetical protein
VRIANIGYGISVDAKFFLQAALEQRMKLETKAINHFTRRKRQPHMEPAARWLADH